MSSLTGLWLFVVVVAQIATLSSGSCGGQLSANTGYITSENYPSDYPHKSDCGWLITAPAWHTIHFLYEDFAIEDHSSCLWDFVDVYDGPSPSSPRLAHKCGTNLPRPVQSSSNKLYIRMVTDSSVSAKGFEARYSVHGSSCGNRLSGVTGIFSSTNYPFNYPHASSCRWIITVPTSHRVYLTFLDFNLEGHTSCMYDYVALYDGSGPTSSLLKKHCGSSLPSPSTFQSTSNQMYVHMLTDGSVTGKGFRAKYAMTGSNCGGIRIAGSSSSYLTSPFYPSNYPHSRDCGWVIIAPSPRCVSLTFLAFDVEGNSGCSYDFVAVYNGATATSPLMKKHCGNSLPYPRTYRSSGTRMYVHLKTDHSVSGRGFRARYTYD